MSGRRRRPPALFATGPTVDLFFLMSASTGIVFVIPKIKMCMDLHMLCQTEVQTKFNLDLLAALLNDANNVGGKCLLMYNLFKN